MQWLSVIFCLLLAIPTQAQTVVSGRVVGAEGQPLPAAHVEVQARNSRASWNRISSNMVAVDADGRYRITVEAEGPVALWFNGALHRPHQVQMFIEAGTPITLDVQLQRKYLDTDQSFTRAVSRHSGFDYDAGVPTEEQPDGTYMAEMPVAVPGDTLVYFFEAAERAGFEGLVFGEVTADGFIYAGRGKYLAVVEAPGDTARVVLRPKQLAGEDAPEPIVQFGAENRRALDYHVFNERLEQRPSITVSHSGSSARLEMPDEAEVQAHLRNLVEEVKAEDDAFRRQLLMLVYLDRGMPYRFGFGRSAFSYGGPGYSTPPLLDVDVLSRILREIPPDSRLWAVNPSYVQIILEQSKYTTDAVDYAERVAQAQADPEVAALVLYNLFQGYFAHQGLSAVAGRYGEQFMERFPQSSLADQVRDYFTSEVKVLPGRRAPDLRAAWMFGGENIFNPDTLDGRVVLLDFWSPSCASCNIDLDMLRQMQAAYADDNFQVLRVALDTDEARLEQASAALEPQPWWEARPAGGFASIFARTHGVLTAPHRVLIDRDGVVLATGGSLFGERLEETLKSVFKH